MVTAVSLILLALSIPLFAAIDTWVYHFSFWNGLKNVGGVGQGENRLFLYFIVFSTLAWSFGTDYRLRKKKRSGLLKKGSQKS